LERINILTVSQAQRKRCRSKIRRHIQLQWRILILHRQLRRQIQRFSQRTRWHLQRQRRQIHRSSTRRLREGCRMDLLDMEDWYVSQYFYSEPCRKRKLTIMQRVLPNGTCRHFSRTESSPTPSPTETVSLFLMYLEAE
jgi:hypothetical protein